MAAMLPCGFTQDIFLEQTIRVGSGRCGGKRRRQAVQPVGDGAIGLDEPVPAFRRHGVDFPQNRVDPVRLGIEQGLQFIRDGAAGQQPGLGCAGVVGVRRIVDQQDDATAGIFGEGGRNQRLAHHIRLLLVGRHQHQQRRPLPVRIERAGGGIERSLGMQAGQAADAAILRALVDEVAARQQVEQAIHQGRLKAQDRTARRSLSQHADQVQRREHGAGDRHASQRNDQANLPKHALFSALRCVRTRLSRLPNRHRPSGGRPQRVRRFVDIAGTDRHARRGSDRPFKDDCHRPLLSTRGFGSHPARTSGSSWRSHGDACLSPVLESRLKFR